jgi:hypothetical protein
MRAKRFHAAIYWVVILAFILGACGGADEPTSEPAPPPTEEPTPTPEPIPGRLAVNEVMPVAAEGEAPWVELFNAGELPVSTAGVVLTDMDDNSYTIPDGSPMIQPGDLVLIQFDGQGPGMDDYDAGDGLVVLHTPETLTAPFAPEGDQVALFSSDVFIPDNAIDFVAWALPPVESDNPAVAAGIWLDGAYVNAERGGRISGVSQPGESLGVFPGQPVGLPNSWVVYATSETTPGEANVVPTPAVMLPGPGAVVFREGFLLGWYDVPHAASYVLQIDDNAEFDSPDVEQVLEETAFKPETPPDEGTYFWRIQAVDAQGEAGPFTTESEITVVDITPPDIADPTAFSQDSDTHTAMKTWPYMTANALMSVGVGVSSMTGEVNSPSVELFEFLSPLQAGEWNIKRIDGLTPLLQHKDSDMICWYGDDEIGARKPWDGPHQDTAGSHTPHGRNYCARASIAMVNNYYGGDLTQDRISFQLFGHRRHRNDLGHDVPTRDREITNLLDWAVQTNITYISSKPTFAQIQGWVNEGRPVVAGVPGHAIVLRGWATFQGEHPSMPVGTPWVAYNDPWYGFMLWERYDRFNLDAVWVPTGTPDGLVLEPTLKEDPDGDGINTFDEVSRFRTDPENPDTDFDCVPDQEDMVGFLYHPVNVYNPTRPDHDSDGWDKQRDPDNDNGGVIDGNEDVNWNGHIDEGETADFFREDDDPKAYACLKPFMVFVDNIYYGLRHSTGMSFILPKVYIYGNDPVPMANATVTVRMDGARSSEQIQITTGDDGSAEGEFTIYSYGTYTLTVENVEGEDMVYAPSMNQVSSITVPVGAAEVPLPEGREETIQAFVAKLSEAFRASNWGFAIERVHPAVIDLYGAPLCTAYLRDQGDPSFNINVTGVSGPEAWDWERDERVTSLENVFEVTASITAHDQTTSSTLHFVQAEDGTFRWLTDCGVPSP